MMMMMMMLTWCHVLKERMAALDLSLSFERNTSWKLSVDVEKE